MKELSKEEHKEYADIKARREQMNKDSWIKNVLRIYPEKSFEEAETLYKKLFLC